MEREVTPVIALSKVCSILAIPIDDVLEAFVVGSRLWQTATAKSDYDLYIVVKNTSPYVVNMDKSKGFVNIHKANIDGIVMTEATYKDFSDLQKCRLEECGVFDLVTLWLPPEFVLRTSLGMIRHWTFNVTALEASVKKVDKRDMLIAAKHANNGNFEKTKKIMVHTVRMIMMAFQILQRGRVIEWNCAGEHFNNWMRNGYHLTTWQSFVEEVIPVKDAALQEFIELATTLR